MAVVLDSATRRRPAPCDHFLVTLLDGLREVTLDMTMSETAEPITDDDIRALLKVWARYQRSKGATFAGLIGQTVIGDIP